MSFPSLRVVDTADGPWAHEPLVTAPAPTPAPPAALAAPRRVRRSLARLFFTSDLAAVTTAAAATALLAFAQPPVGGATHPSFRSLAFLPVAVVVTLAVLALRGSYTGARRRLAPGVADDLLSLVTAICTAGLVLLAAGSAGPLRGRMPLLGVALVVGASLVLVPAFRAMAVALVAADRRRVSRVIVVGSGKVAGDLARRLDRSPLVEVVGTVDDDPATPHDVLGPVDDLPALCRVADADRVVIAFSRRHPSRSAELVLALRDVVQVDVVVRYFELAGWESRLHDVAGLSLLNLGGKAGRLSGAAKRLLDLAVATSLLLVLSPLLLVIAAGVALESGRPVLFRQRRVGRDRRPFTIFKFRTMRGRPLAVAGTPRTLFDVPDPSLVTATGRLLRRTGLDELPQLINVLRGEMSLVGPRPFVAEECADLHGWALRRFDVRPGLTGMWQVCGQHEVSFDELCRLDVQYATSWSLRTDLRILARTPSRLLHGSAPGR